MANHIPLSVVVVVVVLLLPPLPFSAVAVPPLPPESKLEFTLRLRGVRGLAERQRLDGVPTPELGIFAMLRVFNPGDEELCFRGGAATVKHESTSAVLAKGAAPEFCVAAESLKDVRVWAHGEREEWPQEARDGVAAERLRGELRLQVGLELLDDAGTVEVAVDCTLSQDSYPGSHCQSRISYYYEG